jgi:hypothetical protein
MFADAAFGVTVATREENSQMTNPEIDLADRYVRLWNESDAGARQELLRNIWSERAVHRLRPAEEMRAAARAVGFPDAILEARGHEELGRRVTRAYDEFVAPGTFVFRRRDDVARLGNVMKFHWEMVRRSGGDVAGVGLEFLIVDDELRIQEDYQFIEG